MDSTTTTHVKTSRMFIHKMCRVSKFIDCIISDLNTSSLKIKYNTEQTSAVWRQIDIVDTGECVFVFCCVSRAVPEPHYTWPNLHCGIPSTRPCCCGDTWKIYCYTSMSRPTSPCIILMGENSSHLTTGASDAARTPPVQSWRRSVPWYAQRWQQSRECILFDVNGDPRNALT